MQKMKHLLTFALFFLSTLAFAQGPELDWTVHIAGSGRNIITSSLTLDENENVYAVGCFADSIEVNTTKGPVKLLSNNTKGAAGLFIAKINPQAQIEWIKTVSGNTSMGSSGGGDVGMAYWFSIVNDKQNNLYITGHYSDTVDFNPGPGTETRISDFTMSSGGLGGSIGGGGGTPTKVFNLNSFILKLNKDGEFVWVKTLPGKSNAIGSIAIDDNEGTFCVTGYYSDTIYLNERKGNDLLRNKGKNTFIVKYDTSGNLMWSRQIGGGIKASTNEQGNDIHIDKNGFIYMAGFTVDSSEYEPGSGTIILRSPAKPGEDVLVLKLSRKGDFIWAKTIGSTGNGAGARPFAIGTDPEGNVITTGYFQSKGNFDPLQNPAYDVSATPNLSLFVSKLDSAGNYVWAKAFDRPVGGKNGLDNGLTLQVDKKGGIYVGGYFSGDFYFDPDKANANREVFNVPTGNSHIEGYIFKLDNEGIYQWTRHFYSSNGSSAYQGQSLNKNMKLSPNNNIYVGGYFRGTTNFNPLWPGTKDSLTSMTQSSTDGYVAKFLCGELSYLDTTVEMCAAEYQFLEEHFQESGEYTITISNAIACDSIITLHLTLNAVPEAVITTNGFILGSAGSYYSYQWMLGDEIIPGATQSTYDVTGNGSYRLIVTTEAGCTDTSDVYIVNNYDEGNSINGTGTLAGKINIYPSPTQDIVHIDAPVDVNVTLTDVSGRAIRTVRNVRSLSLKDLASGVYLLRITDRDGTLIKVSKVMKQD